MQALARLKQGLDDLDGRCTAHAARCLSLRQKALQQCQQRNNLQHEAESSCIQVVEGRELVEDLSDLLNSIKVQTSAAVVAKQTLQVSVAVTICFC